MNNIITLLNDYQELAGRTDQVPDLSKMTSEKLHLLMLAIGLSGESGEFLEIAKKHVFHDHPLDREAAMKEIGDSLWYAARAAALLGYPLSEAATQNIIKLKKRFPDKFNPKDSLARVDVTKKE